MYPHERSLVQKMENKPFALIGVNSDKSTDELKQAIEKEKMTWRSFYDGGSTNDPIPTARGASGRPPLSLIDHKGLLRQKWEGSPGDAIPDQAIEKVDKEAEEDAKKQSE